jgi:hypothetical protein
MPTRCLLCIPFGAALGLAITAVGFIACTQWIDMSGFCQERF